MVSRITSNTKQSTVRPGHAEYLTSFGEMKSSWKLIRLVDAWFRSVRSGTVYYGMIIPVQFLLTGPRIGNDGASQLYRRAVYNYLPFLCLFVQKCIELLRSLVKVTDLKVAARIGYDQTDGLTTLKLGESKNLNLV